MSDLSEQDKASCYRDFKSSSFLVGTVNSYQSQPSSLKFLAPSQFISLWVFPNLLTASPTLCVPLFFFFFISLPSAYVWLSLPVSTSTLCLSLLFPVFNMLLFFLFFPIFLRLSLSVCLFVSLYVCVCLSFCDSTFIKYIHTYTFPLEYS